MSESSATNARTRISFTLLMSFFWPSMWISYMLVILLQERGFSDSNIGMILSVNAVISVVVQPVWGIISDHIHSVKKTFVLCISACSILFFSLYFIHGSSYQTMFIIWLDMVFRCGLVALLDHWLTSVCVENKRMHYGTIRVAGSISFSAFSFLFGRIISASSVNAVLPISFVLGICTLCIALLTKQPAKEVQIQVKKTPSLNALKDLIRIKDYRMLLIFTLTTSLSTICISSFLSNFFHAVGGSSDQVAFAQSFKALSEIPCFLFAHLLFRRYSARRMLFAGGFIYCFVQVGLLLSRTPLSVTLFFVPVGIAYALMLMAKLQYTIDIVSARYRATAITIIGATEYGLAAVISNLYAGFVLDHYSVRALNVSALIILVGGIIIFSAVEQQRKPTPHENE